MSKRFMDGAIAEGAVADELKTGRDAQREMAPMPPCPHCGESRQDHLWQLLGSQVRCDECGQHYKDEPEDERVGVCTIDPDTQDAPGAQADSIAEQEQNILNLESELAEQVVSLQSEIAERDAKITKQGERLDALHDLIEQQQDGARHLAGRRDKLEWWRDRQHTVNQDIYRQMQRGYDKLALARINGDDAMNQRIQARAIELEHRLDNYQTRLNRLEHAGQVAEQRACEERQHVMAVEL